MQVEIPEDARKILHKLVKAGYEAYIVGGTIRDLLLSQINKNYPPPVDIDVATSARPEEIEEVFLRYKKMYIGARHGTITIRFRGRMYDITTFRAEGQYSDGRHPDYVEFITSLKEDLSRRDLTINAIACDEKGFLHDPFGGIRDLRDGIVRTVGEPSERYEEDALRLLRTIRFAVKLDFVIEERTFNAIREHSKKIVEKNISLERIFTEVQKILSHDPVRGVDLLFRTDLFRYIFPESFEGLSKSYAGEEREFVTEVLRLVGEPLAHWIVLCYPAVLLEKGRKKVSKLLGRMKGLKKDIRLFSENIITKIEGTRHLLTEEVSRGEIELWVRDARHTYRNNHNEFWKETPLTLLKVTSAVMVVEGNEINKEQVTRIEEISGEFDNYFTDKVSEYDGNLAKELGARGKAIRDLLQLWENMRLRHEGLGRDEYVRVAEQLKGEYTLNLEKYLAAVAKGEFLASHFEVRHVLRELRTIDHLLGFFGGTWHIVSAPEAEWWSTVLEELAPGNIVVGNPLEKVEEVSL